MKNKFLLLIALTMFVFSPFSVNAMEIFVQPPEGENISIEVETGDTIEAIKEKIYDNNNNNNYPVDKQKLYYNGEWMKDGRTFGDYYSSSLGNTVKMELDSVVNVILNANGGLFTDKEEYIIEDIYGDTPSNIVFPTREGYVFKGFYTQKDGGINMEYYVEGHVIENEMVFYAHWDVIGTATIDFTKIINGRNLTNFENDLLKILVNNQILISDESDKSFKNSEGKILVKGDNDGNLTPAEGLTSIDNIVYTLSNADKQSLLDEYDESYIPNIIKVIVAEEQEYKVIFDANGGIFNDNKNTKEIEDIINFNYNEFEKPTRDGYSFVGFYTEKTGGKSYDEVMNSEAGIEEDTIFYARWEENSDGGAGTTESDEENPKTFDGIGTSIFMGTISLIGLIGATIYLRRKNKVRAN